MRTPTMRNLETRNNPERLYMMLLHSPEGICLIDRRHVVEFANAAWARMHGYAGASELIGRPLECFHTNEQMKGEVYPFLEMIELIGRYDKRLGRRRSNQSEFTAETAGVLVLDEDGAVIGYVLYAHNPVPPAHHAVGQNVFRNPVHHGVQNRQPFRATPPREKYNRRKR